MANSRSITETMGIVDRTPEDLDYPDFTRILDWAVAPEGKHQNDQEAAVRIAEDLDCFRVLAEANRLTPILFELAVIDDESLQPLYEPPNRRVKPDFLKLSIETETGKPKFVSVLLGFPQCSKQNDVSLVLSAWHRATEDIVKIEKRAIVGELGTYSLSYIWDEMPTNVTAREAQIPNINRHLTEIRDYRESQQKTNRLTVGLPIRYPLGEDTIRQIRDAVQQRVPTPKDSDKPKQVAESLIRHFASTLDADQLSPSTVQKLKQSVLLIVPFTRPYPFDPGTISSSRRKAEADHPGGGLFMLCNRGSLDDSDLSVALAKLGSGITWSLYRSAMLEAQKARIFYREQDLGLFAHMTRSPLVSILSHINKAVDCANRPRREPANELLDLLRSARNMAQRLVAIGDVAKEAVAVRERVSVSGFQKSSSASDLESEVRTLLEQAIETAKSDLGTTKKKRADEVRDVTYELEWLCEPNHSVRTDEKYLQMLLSEIIKNAVHYGGFNSNNQKIRCVANIDSSDSGGNLLLAVVSPLKDAEAKKNLKDILGRKTLFLGLMQISSLARAFGARLPDFSLTTDSPGSLIVTCVIGKTERVLDNPTPRGEAPR